MSNTKPEYGQWYAGKQIFDKRISWEVYGDRVTVITKDFKVIGPAPPGSVPCFSTQCNWIMFHNPNGETIMSSNIEFDKFYPITEMSNLFGWDKHSMISYIDLEGVIHEGSYAGDMSSFKALAVKFHQPMTQADKLIAALNKDHVVQDSMRIVIKNFFGEGLIDALWVKIAQKMGAMSTCDRVDIERWLKGTPGTSRVLPKNIRDKLGNDVLALHHNEGGSKERNVVVTSYGMATSIKDVIHIRNQALVNPSKLPKSINAAESGTDYAMRHLDYNPMHQTFTVGCQTIPLAAVNELLTREGKL